jgi:hypothetical protein
VKASGRKARRKETIRKPRDRWENGVKLDLREIVWEGVEWIYLAQDRN